VPVTFATDCSRGCAAGNSNAKRRVGGIAASEQNREKSKPHHNGSNPCDYRRFLDFEAIAAFHPDFTKRDVRVEVQNVEKPRKLRLKSTFNPYLHAGFRFVGGGIAYPVHNRGYNTVSVTNPAQPTLIAQGITTQFGWKQIVLNGSGLVT
jgi:hypothetical protein